MKSILCDINFVLDIFLKRKPFFQAASALFNKVEKKELTGYLSSLSFPTLYYLLQKELGREKAFKVLERLRIVFRVASVDERIIDLALSSDFKDFEDAVQYYSAVEAGMDCLITRNKADYSLAVLPVFTSEELLVLLEEGVKEVD